MMPNYHPNHQMSVFKCRSQIKRHFFTIVGEETVAGEESWAAMVQGFLGTVCGNYSRVTGTSFPFEQCRLHDKSLFLCKLHITVMLCGDVEEWMPGPRRHPKSIRFMLDWIQYPVQVLFVGDRGGCAVSEQGGGSARCVCLSLGWVQWWFGGLCFPHDPQ